MKAYRNAIDAYLEPAFGPTRLDGIRPRDVSAFVTDAMTRAQGRNKRPLSGKYVNWLLNLAYSIFKGAIGEELVESNPVASVQRPKVERKRWRILEPSEVPRVYKAFSDDRARRVFLTLTLTGIRRSEIVGLRWRHVNLVEGTLRVEESKSEEGERLIALPRTPVDALAEQFTSPPFRSDEDFVSRIRNAARSSRPSGTTTASRRRSRSLASRAISGASTTCAIRRSRISQRPEPRRSRS